MKMKISFGDAGDLTQGTVMLDKCSTTKLQPQP